jgi:hypothetical protein
MGTLGHNMVAVLVAALLQSVAVTGNFQLEVQVVRVRDSVNDCGRLLDVCHLYIDEMCLDPQFEEPGSEEEEQEECSLIKYENDLDLESGLPKTRTLSVTNQPWPVDFRLRIEVMDIDLIPPDDHIEDVVVLESLNTSSEFSEEMDYRNTPDGRITLSMRFRVRCSGGYEGPNCDCLPYNDDVSGHYSCREDGGISCLPGYTNTSNLCRQTDYCVGVVCPSDETCVSNLTSYTCEPPPTSPTTITISSDNCNCETGMKCIEEDGGYRCVCPEGGNCSTPGPSTAAPRQQSGETSSSMPPAVVGAIVAGLLVALLLCAVVVIAVVVCILMRKRRWSKLAPKTNGRGRRGPTKVHPSLAGSQSGVVSNPTYEDPGGLMRTGEEENGSHDEDTLRDLPNPFYHYGRINNSNTDNPLYRDHANQPQQGDNIYSVPRDSTTASTSSQEGEGEGDGGGRYSVPRSPAVEAAGAVYSYATVGAAGEGGGSDTRTDAVSIDGNRYETPTAPSQNVEAPYNTLDHGLQQQRQPRLAELSEAYDTLNHDRH